MDNALEEFARQGYGASSVNAVCSAQGISKGIIYHYFKTKDALVSGLRGGVFRTAYGISPGE